MRVALLFEACCPHGPRSWKELSGRNTRRHHPPPRCPFYLLARLVAEAPAIGLSGLCRPQDLKAGGQGSSGCSFSLAEASWSRSYASLPQREAAEQAPPTRRVAAQPQLPGRRREPGEFLPSTFSRCACPWNTSREQQGLPHSSASGVQLHR